ncbi:MAG TPA: hypothetical protein VK603_23425 [Candidatus Saccharimonadales bacterium]|nr:hypothetical protein [Candidatus Saccharimonadales bacterium]
MISGKLIRHQLYSHNGKGKQSRRFHSADRFSILEYGSDERFTGYLDSASSGTVVFIDGYPLGELTISITGKANRSYGVKAQTKKRAPGKLPNVMPLSRYQKISRSFLILQSAQAAG